MSTTSNIELSISYAENINIIENKDIQRWLNGNKCYRFKRPKKGTVWPFDYFLSFPDKETSTVFKLKFNL